MREHNFAPALHGYVGGFGGGKYIISMMGIHRGCLYIFSP